MNLGKKILAISVALAMVMGMAGNVAADDVSDLQAQINALLAQLTTLQTQLAGLGGATATCPCTFTRNLYPDMSGDDVKCLQEHLNASGHELAASGVGSPGSETTYFGPLTRAAVKAWQDANGVEYGAWWGYFGPISQAKYDALCAAPAVVCADYTTEDECPATCFWYDDACNTTAQPASDFDNEEDCEAADYYWYDDACNEEEEVVLPLEGGAGSVQSYNLASGIANEEVGEDEEDVTVAGLEIEADEGSDIRIMAARLTFNEDTAEHDFEDFADEVSLWLGSEEVARVDGDTFNENNNWIRTVTLSGDDTIIRASETGTLYAKISGVSNLDSADVGKTWTVDFTSIRFMDAQGTVISEDPTVNTTTFSFETFAAAARTNFKITAGEDVLTVNLAHVINVDADDDTDDVDILSFNVEIKGSSDVYLDALPVNFVVTATHVDDMINGLNLLMDGERVGSANVGSDCIEDFVNCVDVGVAETYLFDNMDLTLEAGEDYEFMVQIDLLSTGDDLAVGDTIRATFGETQTQLADFEAEDDSGEDLVDGDKNGTVTGLASVVYDIGIMVELVSITAVKTVGDPTAVGADDSGTFEITFDVTAFDADGYIDLTAPDETGAGAASKIVVIGAGTVLAEITSPTGATAYSEAFLVVEETTERFTITTNILATTSGFFNVALTDLRYTDANQEGDLSYTFNLGAYKTASLYLIVY